MFQFLFKKIIYFEVGHSYEKGIKWCYKFEIKLFNEAHAS